MTTTATAASPIFTELTTIHGFLRATAGELPDPSGITVHGISAEYPSVSLLFASLDDLREWAAYLQVPVAERDARERHQQIHHHAHAQWGPTHGQMVEFTMVYIEKVPAAAPMDCEAV